MRLDLFDVLSRPFVTHDFLLRRLFFFLSHAKLLVWSSGLLPHIKCVASYVFHSEYELARRRYYFAGKASTRDSALIRSRDSGVLIGCRFRSPEIRKPRGFALTHWSFLCVHFHNLIQQRGTMSDISIPRGRIRSFVERIEHLDTELQELNESKKEVFSEAKAEGFDVKILKEIIKLRKQDKDERDERDTLLDIYMRAMKTAGPELAAKAA